MDVNSTTVRQTMSRFAVRSLIHGHTHRAAIHEFELDGKSARRIVLPDWYGSGGYVLWSEDGPATHTF